MPGPGNRSNWARQLTREQKATIARIRLKAKPGIVRHHGTDGWRVYIIPSLGPAQYLELRHRLGFGRVARWRIERNGDVSAHNDEGTSTSLHLAEKTSLTSSQQPPAQA